MQNKYNKKCSLQFQLSGEKDEIDVPDLFLKKSTVSCLDKYDADHLHYKAQDQSEENQRSTRQKQKFLGEISELVAKKQKNPFMKAKLACIVHNENNLFHVHRKYSPCEGPGSSSTLEDMDEESSDIGDNITTMKLLRVQQTKNHKQVIKNVIENNQQH